MALPQQGLLDAKVFWTQATATALPRNLLHGLDHVASTQAPARSALSAIA